MTEKTQETIIAKFVKSSGVMIFLEGQETGIPCKLKILSIIKKGDKVQARQRIPVAGQHRCKGEPGDCQCRPARRG